MECKAAEVAGSAGWAYLRRSNLEPLPPDLLWRQYVQLTEVEEAFRVLKSELNLRPIWDRTGPRVEAHVMVAFLGYCLWVCLKHKLQQRHRPLTPAQVLEVLGGMMMVEVWFRLRDGRNLCLPCYTNQSRGAGADPSSPGLGITRAATPCRSTPQTCRTEDRVATEASASPSIPLKSHHI